MDFEFETKRTGLANAFADAGRDLLNYMGTGAALAAIPNTDPPQYVVAGTLPMIAKMLPGVEPTSPAVAPSQVPAELTDERIEAIWNSIDGKRVIAGESQLNWNAALRKAFAKAIASEVRLSAVREARNEALEKEVERLKALLEKRHKANFLISQALHNAMVGNQAAWIEWQHGAGAEAAMAWIHNGLVGPGLIPDGKEAQPWFDANVDDRYEIPPMSESPAASKEGDASHG
jgi:hypothetical protein